MNQNLIKLLMARTTNGYLELKKICKQNDIEGYKKLRDKYLKSGNRKRFKNNMIKLILYMQVEAKPEIKQEAKPEKQVVKEQKPKKKQRKHNKNLGKNLTKDHEDLYNYIENELGITHKKCSMGASKKGNKFKIVHDGDRKCSIREFRLNEISKNENNKIICKKKIPLQGNCIKCDDLWRRARLDACGAKNNGKTPKEMYEKYETDYGKTTKECSSCKKEIKCTNFSLSRNMECGLHNMCKVCSLIYGNAMGNRWIIYMPDGNFKYKTKSQEFKIHE